MGREFLRDGPERDRLLLQLLIEKHFPEYVEWRVQQESQSIDKKHSKREARNKDPGRRLQDQHPDSRVVVAFRGPEKRRGDRWEKRD